MTLVVVARLTTVNATPPLNCHVQTSQDATPHDILEFVTQFSSLIIKIKIILTSIILKMAMNEQFRI
jgi:hypothetical protein